MNYRTAIFLAILLAIFAASIGIGISVYNLLQLFLAPPAKQVRVIPCATDTFTCPDGQTVRRVQPSCTFATCALATSTATSSKGGNIATSTGVLNWSVTGTVIGKVIISPTCPVETNPPKPECEPKGYATELKAYTKDGKEVDSTKTSSTGTFEMSLPVGSYVLRVVKTGLYPRCEDKLVKISAANSTVTAISCDSGIR